MSAEANLGIKDGVSFQVKERRHQDGGSLRLRLAGHLDADGSTILVDELEKWLEDGVRTVELDFTDVDFISSSGVGSLIVSIGEYRDASGDVVVCGLSDSLHAVFEMLDLLDFVNIR